MLPDDDEEEAPLRERRKKCRGSSRRRLEIQVPQSTPALEAVVECSGDPVRTNITFTNPLTTDCPSGSTAPTPAAPVTASAALESSLFAAYQTPDDSPSAAREALLQVNLVMEHMKMVHEAS